MKCEIIIDSDCEEKVIIYARENNSLIKEIKSLAEQSSKEIIGYNLTNKTERDLFISDTVSMLMEDIYEE